MVIKAYREDTFQTTHENQIFDQLFNKLQEQWGDSEELVLLLGNFHCEDKEIDAAVIKRKSITIIDFKDYGGNITFEDSPEEKTKWFADNTEIKAGQYTNPYWQIKSNKSALIKFFEKINYSSHNQPNLGHISGLVIFHQPISCDESKFSYQVKSWFHVVDFDHAVERLLQIASQEINLSNQDLQEIANQFALPEYTPINAQHSTTKNTYYAEINRENPTAFLFAIDCSGSMSKSIEGTELSKAKVLSNV